LTESTLIFIFYSGQQVGLAIFKLGFEFSGVGTIFFGFHMIWLV